MKKEFGNIDYKALDILIRYKNIPFSDIPKDEAEYALNAGYLFKESIISHDNSVRELFSIVQKIKKKDVVSSFLSSFVSNDVYKRTGLATYAIMQSFPFHSFTPDVQVKEITKVTPCICCSAYQMSYANERNFINLLRICTGGIKHNVYRYLFYLKEQMKLKEEKPCDGDFKLFVELVQFIDHLDKNATPTGLIKLLKKRKLFKYNDEQQLHALIETLGYCSILNTDMQKGPLYEFTNLAVAPRKTHNSDWAYPVDFWMVRDGINKDAFNFWFEDYPDLCLSLT